jgi:hypothetical protein
VLVAQALEMHDGGLVARLFGGGLIARLLERWEHRIEVRRQLAHPRARLLVRVCHRRHRRTH